MCISSALLALGVSAALAVPTSAARPDPAALLRAGMRPTAAYEGEVSVITWYGKKTRARELLVRFAPPDRFRREIVDQFGGTSQLIVSDGATEWFYDRGRRTAWRTSPADAEDKVLGPEDEFELLSENYVYAVTGEEPVAGRPCWVVEIRARADRRLVRSLWLDERTRVILQSRSFQADGSAASTMRFVKVSFDPRPEAEAFRFSPPVGSRVLASRLQPDFLELEDARTASGVDPRQPSWLPSGYVFESLNVVPYAGKSLLHYRFSDGIDALSLFQCPPGVRPEFGDLPQERVRLGRGGARLSFGPEGKVLAWARGRESFVLVGDLPLDEMRRVAESVR